MFLFIYTCRNYIKGHILILFFFPIRIQIIVSMKCDDSIISTATDSICQKNSNQSTDVAYHLLSKSKITDRDLKHKKNRFCKIKNQLDAIDFLQEYLQNENSEILIDLLCKIAQEINSYSSSSVNNNHFDLTSMFNTNLQLSNNKEKKNKLKN